MHTISTKFKDECLWILSLEIDWNLYTAHWAHTHTLALALALQWRTVFTHASNFTNVITEQKNRMSLKPEFLIRLVFFHSHVDTGNLKRVCVWAAHHRIFPSNRCGLSFLHVVMWNHMRFVTVIIQQSDSFASKQTVASHLPHNTNVNDIRLN